MSVAVPLLQTIRGMCSDEEPHVAIDAKLAEAIDLLTGACAAGPAGAGTCVRGTARCTQAHEPTLLEQLDAAEAQLRAAVDRLRQARYDRHGKDGAAEVDVNAASALCMAAAARAVATTEDVSGGLVAGFGRCTPEVGRHYHGSGETCECGAIANVRKRV